MHNIQQNLSQLYQFHIIPGWRWNDTLWQRFRAAFSLVPMCRDGFGNVYLNCNKIEDLLGRISNGGVVIFQAHLDHPGGISTGKVLEQDSKTLSCAVWMGSYNYSLEGKSVCICDTENGRLENCIVEKDTRRFDERFIYYWNSNHPKKSAPVHYPSHLPTLDSHNDVISGWALDDQLNCAILLEIFKNKLPKNVIGLLTLDEERGGQGVEHFMQLVENSCGGSRPVFINLEAPAENEQLGLLMGGGVKIRTADSRAVFSTSLCDKIKSILTTNESMEIKSGGTEASLLSKNGWVAASLALPIRYAHNGSRDGRWCEEEASLVDVKDMYNAVTNLTNNANELLALKNTTTTNSHTTQINVIDEATDLLELIKDNKTYGDYLLNAANKWHKRHADYGLKFQSPSANQYESYRQNIIDNNWNRLDSAQLRSYINELLPKLCDYTNIHTSDTLNIYLLFADNFNAKQIKDGIGLSVKRIDTTDLHRILLHELTHWLTSRKLNEGFVRAPARSLISEGLACYLSAVILDIPAQHTLNLEKERYESLYQKDRLLKDMFIKMLNGSSVEMKGNRHKILSQVDIWNPFTISNDNPYNKYGYYLGFNYFKYCAEKGCEVKKIIHSPTLALQLLDEYLSS